MRQKDGAEPDDAQYPPQPLHLHLDQSDDIQNINAWIDDLPDQLALPTTVGGMKEPRARFSYHNSKNTTNNPGWCL